MAAPPRKKCPLALLALGGAIATILSLEIALHVISPPVKIAVNMIYDAELGHKGVENTIVTTNTYEYYNQAGFREKTLLHFPYHSLKTPGQPRVAVIGDSITQAYGIAKEDRFTETLGRYLVRHHYSNPEVFNYGTPDFGTLEEYFVYERFARLEHPDLVVLQFLGLNDFLNNGIYFAGKNQSHTDLWRPYALDPREAPAPSVLEKYGLPVGSAFPLQQKMRKISYLYRIWEGIQIARQLNRSSATKPDCNLAIQLFLTEPSAAWQASLAATKLIAQKFQASVTQTGEANLVAVYFPSNVEVVDEMWTKGITPLLERCHPQEKFARWEGERKFLSTFQAANVETLSLRQAFLSYPGDRKELFVSDGHLSELGHRLAAETLGRYLSEKHSARLGRK